MIKMKKMDQSDYDSFSGINNDVGYINWDCNLYTSQKEKVSVAVIRDGNEIGIYSIEVDEDTGIEDTRSWLISMNSVYLAEFLLDNLDADDLKEIDLVRLGFMTCDN